MDNYVVIISDGETSQTFNCTKEEIPGLIATFLNDEYLMVATIVKTITEEMYES